MGASQARAEGGGQKDRAQQRAGRQAKADVRHAERAFDAQTLLTQGHGAQDLLGLALIGRGVMTRQSMRMRSGPMP